jgi:hypothetical protein
MFYCISIGVMKTSKNQNRRRYLATQYCVTADEISYITTGSYLLERPNGHETDHSVDGRLTILEMMCRISATKQDP